MSLSEENIQQVLQENKALQLENQELKESA